MDQGKPRQDKEVASGVGSYSAGTVVVEVVVRIDYLEDIVTEGSNYHDSDMMGYDNLGHVIKIRREEYGKDGNAVTNSIACRI